MRMLERGLGCLPDKYVDLDICSIDTRQLMNGISDRHEDTSSIFQYLISGEYVCNFQKLLSKSSSNRWANNDLKAL